MIGSLPNGSNTTAMNTTGTPAHMAARRATPEESDQPVLATGTPTDTDASDTHPPPKSGEPVGSGLAAGESGPEAPEDLAGALWELGQAEAWAREDGFPIPSAEVLKDTEALLRQLYRIYPCRYDVDPSDLGDMMIRAGPEYGRSIMVVRHTDGTAWCSVCVPERNSAISYNSEDFVSEETLREAVAVMKGEKEPPPSRASRR